MPWWAVIFLALSTAVLGAYLQSRRERKGALRDYALAEVKEFAAAAPGWLDLVGAAIRGRNEGGVDEEAAVRDADRALADARRLLATLVVALGGPDRKPAQDAIGLVAFLEMALDEVRRWPPEVEDDELEADADTPASEREAEYDFVWGEKVEETLAEAQVFLDFAEQALGYFSRTTARQLDPTAADTLNAMLQRISRSLRHPIRHLRFKKRLRVQQNQQAARMAELLAARTRSEETPPQE
jgi:hypothetical protein